MHTKWDELSYELRTESRTRYLTIVPHFQKVSKGWFDTGQYTIFEKGKALGNIYMDLYTGGKDQWDGSKDEFSPQEFRDIANHIAYTPVK